MPSYIHTYTGKMVDPLALQHEDVDIHDIAHHLANQCRFSGATRKFYSVAQHSVLCSKWVDKEHALVTLLHDASEAYLQDMARPLKMHPTLGQAYRGAETRAERVIAEVFGIPYPYPQEVKDADNTLLITEARDLMHGTEKWGTKYDELTPLEKPIEPWSPLKSEKLFLERFEKLTGE